MTHYQRILEHLQTYGSITSWQAIEKYGFTRLSHYIYLLRNQGYNITSKQETQLNRFGDKVHFNKYVLEGAENVRK